MNQTMKPMLSDEGGNDIIIVDRKYKNAPTNLKQTLILQQTRAKACNFEPTTCFDLKDGGFLISDMNSDLEGDACITLY